MFTVKNLNIRVTRKFLLMKIPKQVFQTWTILKSYKDKKKMFSKKNPECFSIKTINPICFMKMLWLNSATWCFQKNIWFRIGFYVVDTPQFMEILLILGNWCLVIILNMSYLLKAHLHLHLHLHEIRNTWFIGQVSIPMKVIISEHYYNIEYVIWRKVSIFYILIIWNGYLYQWHCTFTLNATGSLIVYKFVFNIL